MKIPSFIRWVLGRAPVQAFLKGLIAAWDDAGHKVATRLRTREPYTLTAEAGVKATLSVIENRLAPGVPFSVV
jgi:hypothetical protein